MKDIYKVLFRHFSGQSTEDEELMINEFKKNNSSEYEMFKKIWIKEDLKIHNFDSKKAWTIFSIKARILAKPIPFYLKFRNIAAALVVLILSSVSTFYLLNNINKSEMIVNENLTFNPSLFDLPDGSRIWLHHGSKISYQKSFSNKDRSINLSGKAFFEIAKDQKHPFTIHTSNSQVRVLGTSFQINAKDFETEVSVKTGTVEVSSINNEHKVILQQNQSAFVTEKGIDMLNEISINLLSWQNGVFEFNNIPIREVIKDLNTYYNDRIEIDSQSIFDCNLTARFDNNELEDIINIIKTSCNLEIVLTNDKYFVK